MLAGEGLIRRRAGAARATPVVFDALDAQPGAGPALLAAGGAALMPVAAGGAVVVPAPAPSIGEYTTLAPLDAPASAHPLWLRAADQCQRSLRRPLPVLLDLLVAATVVAVVSASPAAALPGVGATLVGGLVFGVWKHRSSVQGQGVTWYGRRILPVVCLEAAGLYATGGLAGSGGPTARQAAVAALATALALTVLHSLVWILVAWARRRGLGLARTLVIGSADQVRDAQHRIRMVPEAGLECAHAQVTSWLPDTPARSRALVEALIADHHISHVVCTASDAAADSVARDVIRYAPPAVDVTIIHPVPLATSAPTRIGDVAVTCLGRPAWGTDLCKRAFDLAAALVLLTVLAPLMALTALAVRLGDPGPVVFRQRRTGRGNRQFTIYKFRSMVRDAEDLKAGLMDRNVADGLLFKAENDPRITRVGEVIRRFSVDELPQLLNVVKGDMSLVGPRPLPTVFDDSDAFAQIRHQVLPGITGLWQVKGANALPFDDMIDLDCSYVTTRSLGLDLRILVQTLPAVLVRRDPY